MKDFGKYIIEKLRVSKHISTEINLDSFKNDIAIVNFSYIHLNIPSYYGKGEVTYDVVKDKSRNIIGYVEEFVEGGEPIYTLIVLDDTYDYFCNEFDLEEDEEYGMICPEELYDILFYKIPDFDSENNIYLTSVSIWLNTREGLLSKNDPDYIKFEETYREIKNTLSRR
jgi:hypothetical protein